MDMRTETTLTRAREEAMATPLDKIDVSRSERFAVGAHWPFFDRLRAEDPAIMIVIFCSQLSMSTFLVVHNCKQCSVCYISC